MTQESNDPRAAVLQRPRDFLRYGVSVFEQAGLVYGQGTESALDEAAFIVASALHLPQPLPDGFMDAQLLPEERAHILGLFDRRVQERVPAAHLLGQAWFCGLKFSISPDVIVPRSPFAELIADRFAPWLQVEPESIADLCAGSGCIGIAAALYFPESSVDLIEIDPSVARLAQKNVDEYQLGDQVRVLQQDLFDSDETGRYDLIVCNPPYVPETEWAALPPEFHHEPKLALASGDDGMDLPRRILAEAANFLTENGVLILEVGAYAQEFEAAFPDLDVTWIELEQGGEGLCLIQRSALLA